MVWFGGKNRRSSKTSERIVFGQINSLLSLLVEKTQISKRIFDFFGRVLPVPKTIIRGVPIKIILPLNQVGVYNTFKNWGRESRKSWIGSIALRKVVFFLM